MREPDGHPFLQALGQVLSLAMSLPLTERRQRAVGDVALRLAVADQADVDRRRDALAELPGELLARRHRLPGELLGAARRRGDPIELLEGSQRRSLACSQHERRLVTIGVVGKRSDGLGLAPRVVREVQRHVVARDSTHV